MQYRESTQISSSILDRYLRYELEQEESVDLKRNFITSLL